MKKIFLFIAVAVSLFLWGLPVFNASGNEKFVEIASAKSEDEKPETPERIIAQKCKEGIIVEGAEPRTAYFSMGMGNLTNDSIPLFRNCFYYKGKIYMHLIEKLTNPQIHSCFVLVNTPITPERSCYLYCESPILGRYAKVRADLYCEGMVMVVSIDYVGGKIPENSILSDLDRRMYIYPINLLGCEIVRHN